MPLSEQHRIILINALVLLVIIVLIITIPRDLFEPEPPDPPEPPRRVAEVATTGEESLLVLLSEYNFDHTPRFRARLEPDARFCTSIPFIEPSLCIPPAQELVFSFENETSFGVLGYAVMLDSASARSVMSRYGALTRAADNTYLSVGTSLDSISDHARITEPDEVLVFYHPTGNRFEHAWIARFDQLLIYGYENTPERSITRKFTHTFNAEARSLVLDRYNLSYRAFGEGS